MFQHFRIPISFKIRSLPSHLLQISISAHFRASLYFIITQPFKCVYLQPFFLSMYLIRSLISASFQNNNASKPFLRISITHSNFIVNEFKFFLELYLFSIQFSNKFSLDIHCNKRNCKESGWKGGFFMHKH